MKTLCPWWNNAHRLLSQPWWFWWFFRSRWSVRGTFVFWCYLVLKWYLRTKMWRGSTPCHGAETPKLVSSRRPRAWDSLLDLALYVPPLLASLSFRLVHFKIYQLFIYLHLQISPLMQSTNATPPTVPLLTACYCLVRQNGQQPRGRVPVVGCPQPLRRRH